MVGKSYGYVIFDDDYCATALNKESAIKHIQERLLENENRKKFVKSRIIDEGYPKTNYSDDFMKDFIHDMLIRDPYYFDVIFYTEVPCIEY